MAENRQAHIKPDGTCPRERQPQRRAGSMLARSRTGVFRSLAATFFCTCAAAVSTSPASVAGPNPDHGAAGLISLSGYPPVRTIGMIVPPGAPTAGSGLIRVALENTGLTVENASGAPGEEIPLSIKIGTYDAEKYSFLMIRGLPAEFNLSAGFRLKDRWAVSLKDLANLSLTPPPGYQGTVTLEVMLVRGQDKPVEHHDLTVQIGKAGKKVGANAPDTKPTVARPAEPGDTTAALAPSVAPDAPPPPVDPPKAAKPAEPVARAKASEISPAEENAMLKRASTILDEGDVSSARLLLEHIARKGSGKGALALAQTYDPAFLRSLNTLGLKPNAEKAREWYAVAIELGEDSARERLSALAGQ